MAMERKAPTRTAGEGRTEALEHSRAEDARLMQRINAAAGRLHQLWSAHGPDDPEALQRRRLAVAALQAEIATLYEERRQLVAQRSLRADDRSRRDARALAAA